MRFKLKNVRKQFYLKSVADLDGHLDRKKELVPL